MQTLVIPRLTTHSKQGQFVIHFDHDNLVSHMHDRFVTRVFVSHNQFRQRPSMVEESQNCPHLLCFVYVQ